MQNSFLRVVEFLLVCCMGGQLIAGNLAMGDEEKLESSASSSTNKSQQTLSVKNLLKVLCQTSKVDGAPKKVAKDSSLESHNLIKKTEEEKEEGKTSSSGKSLQSQLLYVTPAVLPKEEYRNKYKQWLKYEQIFKRDCVELHGWFYERRKCPLIVYYGGNAEDVTTSLWWMKSLKNYAFLLVNYRGYGLSTGEPKESDIVEDNVAILKNILKKTKRNPSDVILVGRSLGTGVAMQVAAQIPVGRVVLITPFDSIRSVAERHFWFLPLDLLLKDNWDSVGCAAQVQSKVVFITAEKDELIPAPHSEKLAKALKTSPSYHVIKMATHTDVVSKPGFDEVFKKALKEK